MGRRNAAPTAASGLLDPVRLEIPALDVDAAIVPVGVDPAGAMAVPDDAAQVGWYRWGPAPGEAGNAVLAGHVDTRAQGAGALFDLSQVTPGTVVRVTGSDGVVRSFAVEARRDVAKADLRTAELFTRDGPGRLVVVTCGGEFDTATGRYADNVVVTATATA